MKCEVWYKFYTESGMERRDHLDNNGKGFSRDEAENVATQLNEREIVVPGSVEILTFRKAS